MMYLRNRTAAMISISLLLAFLLACSGSGTSGSQAPIGGVSLSPLVVASRVSVVDAQQNAKPAAKAAAPTGIRSLLAGLNIISNPLAPTTDYMLDIPTIYVNERSVEAFEDINGILCYFKQTRYDKMINQGPYLAMLDHGLCENNAQNSTDATGTAAPNYMLWTVDSTRESETSPHIVSIWFADTYSSPWAPNGQVIVAQMNITEGADTAPPYGKFQINFFAFDPVLGLEVDRGLLISLPNPETGEALLQFADETTDFSLIKKATLSKYADGSGGGTVLSIENIPPDAVRFDIAFNTTHFLRHNYDGNPDVCLDRVNFNESAWRYGLYDQNGMRVNVNSGFSIMKDGKYGWVGYWGLWLDNTTLASGDTVNRHDFSTNADTPYTVFQSGGKLKKHTKKSLTLGGIKNVPLFWWDNGSNYQVVWDGSAFIPMSKEVSSDPYSPTWMTCGVTETATTTICTVTSLVLPSTTMSEFNFWSQSLGGQVRVPLDCTFVSTSPDCSASNTTKVVFFAEDIVYPGDATFPSTLGCFDNCPNVTASGIDTTNPFLSTPTAAADAYVYNFDNSALILKYSGNPAIQTAAISGYDWGIMTGPLFDPVLLSANPNPFSCDWDLTQFCSWKAWNLDVFYTWETGLNDWNKFTGLKDSSGAFVRFDPPIRVQYTHTQTNAAAFDAKYNGATFYLEYGGFGNLQGIPGGCVNRDTGEPTPYCDNTTMWVPEFTIPDDDGAGNLTEVVNSDDSSVRYLVKALEMEQRMQGLALADCAFATKPYPLPSMTLWNEPTCERTPPEVTTAPKVIGGVVQ